MTTEIISNLDTDGALLNVAGVDSLVQQMQQDQKDDNNKLADVTARRTKLANVIAATDKEECLNWFLQLGGLRLLDKWLQESHRGEVGGSGTPKEGDKGVEELLLGLLRALERLPVDLEALKTCVVGKSVNHLRSHKNVEIQKKARKLVDVWKKRVDSEMKLLGEVKPAGGNVILWSCKQSWPELVHSQSVKGSGDPAEVAVKSSGATAGNAKTVQNGPSSGDDHVKLTAGWGKAGSPILPAVKNNNSKLSAGNVDSDVHAELTKDEKSSSSSHLASGAGKCATMSWKDEVENGAVTPKFAGDDSRLSNKGQSGGNSSDGSKEVGSGKPDVWSWNLAAEEAGSPAGGTKKGNVEFGGSEQRLIVRIPNSARSPAWATGGIGGLVSRSSSPSAGEHQVCITSAGDTAGKYRSQVDPAHCSSLENLDARAEDQVKFGELTTNEKTVGQEVEGIGADMNHKIGVPDNEMMVNGVEVCQASLGIIPTDLQKGLTYACSKPENLGMELDYPQNLAGFVGDEVARPSKLSSMKSGDGAMSLLATVAGESAGGSAINVSQRVDRSGNTGQAKMDADGACQGRNQQLADAVRIPSDVASSFPQRLRDIDNDEKEQHNIHSFGLHCRPNCEDAKQEPANNSTEQVAGVVRTVAMPIVELCNGINVRGADYLSAYGVASLELRMSGTEEGIMEDRELGQLLGKGDDFEAQRIDDFDSEFPEEYILEVARQAPDGVEQMENYCKSFSNSLLERDAHDSKSLAMPAGNEPRASSVANALDADNRRSLTVVEQPITDAQEFIYNAGNCGLHLDGTRSIVAVNLDDAANAPIGSGLQEEDVTNKMKTAEWAYTSMSPSLQRQGQQQELNQQGWRIGDRNPSLSREPITLSPACSHPLFKPKVSQQAAESCGPCEAAVGGSEVFERPVFDLNEGFAEDSPQDDATILPVSVTPSLAHPIVSGALASGVAAPIAVLAATKGAFIPPASPSRNKGDLGWKGSAATSAFRPAEPRRTPERLHSNGESIASDANVSMTAVTRKRVRPLLEFDLNVADERVPHEVGVKATALSSQGSVFGMSLYNNSVPSSLVSGVTYVKQDSSLLTLKPESSSSAYPLSNGGSGSVRSSQAQAPQRSEQGGIQPTLNLDLNQMDDSMPVENCMPVSVDLWGTVKGLGSSARSNYSSMQPQPLRMMDIDLNDGPSFEEGGSEEPAVHTFMSRKPPARNLGSSAMALTGLRMGGETRSLSPWFSGLGSGSSGDPLLPFLSARPLDSGFSVSAADALVNASVGAGPSEAPASTGSNFCGVMFRAGGPESALPAVVYSGSERMSLGGRYGPYSVFRNSSAFLSSSASYPATCTPYMSNVSPFPSMSSQPLVSPTTMTSSYVIGSTDNVGGWSRPSLDLNSGPEAGEHETTLREDGMLGSLPPLHPGAPLFTDLSVTLAQVAASSKPGVSPVVKRKEPEGGWNIHRGGII